MKKTIKIWDKVAQQTLLFEIKTTSCSKCGKDIELDIDNDIYYYPEDKEGDELFCSEECAEEFLNGGIKNE